MITFAALLALASSVWFIGDYTSRANWWGSSVGISVVATVACTGALAIGTLVRLHAHTPAGDALIVVIYLAVAAVIFWRDLMMRRANRRPKE